ncbi:MAG TPA: VWA domain-containing protein [Pyrinomonadaceae bacterium]|jgi:VWFA-related protein
MNGQSLLALALALALLSSAFAQQPPASRQTPTEQTGDDVVKITTNLVQVDAIVTDRKGKVVTDLSPSEFQIFEDGRPQQITNFSFVEANAPNQLVAGGGTPVAPKSKEKSGAAPIPVPPVRLKPEQVRRTVALVVDDLGLSFESTHFVRRALRKFVTEQMQDGDLVAIIRTGAGVGALQQFTADKQLLYAAIERVQWNARGRSGLAAFARIEDDPLFNFRNRPTLNPNVSTQELTPVIPNESNMRNPIKETTNQINDFREELYSVGTLGAINFIVRGMRELPGRKSIVLMSDGIALFNTQNEHNDRTLESMRRLTDLANRASVVVYAIDARGLPVLLPGAGDNTTGIKRDIGTRLISGISGPGVNNQMNQSSLEYFESQGGLSYLASQTGGFFVHNNNDINQGLGRVLEDQKGYYLIGYRPDDSTFDAKTGRKRFHHIGVRVTRPGVSVRTRTGFYGISDEDARPVRRTRAQQLLAAITSPFASSDVNLRLTSLFLNDTEYGPFMRSLIYVDARTLNFKEQPDGSRQANVDVVAMTFGDDGMVVDQRTRTEAVIVRGAQYEQALKNGLIFGINLPIRKAGAYQLRVAVRDATTERVGSASQYIEVPDLKKNRLTLSGIYLASNRRAEALAPPQGGQTTPASAEAEGSLGGQDPQSGPAIRRFRPGTVIDYGFEVYNAKLDKTTGRPQLQTQVRLFKDNQMVYAGKIIPVTGEAADRKRVSAIGHLQLGSNLAPGEYILQVVVVDLLAKEKQQLTQQWIDFEIK